MVGPSSALTVMRCLNESPSKKEGKSAHHQLFHGDNVASMKALPKRKGNSNLTISFTLCYVLASMKALPKRKGNSHPKLARNHAAETGTPREPRGRPHKKYTQTSLHAPKHP